MRDDMELLDINVGSNELEVNDDQKALFRDWHTSINISGVKFFFGFVQLLRRFIKYISQTPALTTNLARKNGSIEKCDESCAAEFKT